MSQRDEKKAQFAPNKKSSNFWLVVVALVVTGVALGGWIFTPGSKGSSAGVAKSADGSSLTLPLASVNDGQAHFFTHQGQGAELKFFAVKSADGKLRTAFDTCDVCYKAKKGYRQEGASMICNNCNQAFATDKIGDISGGCNPAPLKATIVGESVVIALADLETGAWYFK